MSKGSEFQTWFPQRGKEHNDRNACIEVRHIEVTTPFLKWWLSRIYVTIILVLLAFKLV